MNTLQVLLSAWRDAEAGGDAAVLDALLAADFRGDGPLGFVLDKERWLDRHRSGDLAVDSFGWRPGVVRTANGTAVAVGVLSQVARYRGRDCSGEFACTLVAVRRAGHWTIVNLQLGFGHLADVRGGPAQQASTQERTTSHQEIQEILMAGNEALPTPDPALRLLDRFAGTWDMTGRTVGSDVENVSGQTTFEWLPGGFFLQQRIELDFTGFQVRGLELIGYDPDTGTFPSTVYPNMAGVPIPYRWEIDGDDLTITTEALGAVFHGSWSTDGTSFSGGWRPIPGREGAGNISYDVWGSRAQADS